MVGDRAVQLRFENNHYALNTAIEQGAVFDSSRYLTKDHAYFVFKNETFQTNLGTALAITGVRNNIVTILEDSIFENNIGAKGASLDVTNIASLLARNNVFFFQFKYTLPPELQNVLNLWQDSLKEKTAEVDPISGNVIY